jgi:hypothetical protein
MRPSDVEYWVLNLAELVRKRKPVEDSRVELKAEWPDADHRAARRLGGHANAARLEPILWVIGLDEKAGAVRSAPLKELSSWWAQLERAFNGITPALLHVVSVRIGDETVVGLLFDTSRAPFVVTVPTGGPIDRDVPWREGNRTRSATREDLLRVLVPATRAPRVDVLAGKLEVIESSTRGRREDRWSLELRIYLTPQTRDVVYVPFHTGTVSIRWPGRVTPLEDERMLFGTGNIEATSSELIIRGPGAATLAGSATLQQNLVGASLEIEFVASYKTTEDLALIATGTLAPSEASLNTNVTALWKLKVQSPPNAA